MISLRTPAADASIGVAGVAGFIFGVAACVQADAATEKWKRLMLMRMSGLNRKAMPYATLPSWPRRAVRICALPFGRQQRVHRLCRGTPMNGGRNSVPGRRSSISAPGGQATITKPVEDSNTEMEIVLIAEDLSGKNMMTVCCALTT
jgi:hypothetical protein